MFFIKYIKKTVKKIGSVKKMNTFVKNLFKAFSIHLF